MRTRLFHVFHLVSRPMTLGMRCAAFDAKGRVFLVRHTYVPGWYMPGGGIDAGETALEALRRELREEGNLDLPEPPQLLSVHFNRRASRRDHVLFYVARNVEQTTPKPADREIAESGFFDFSALPDGVTAATLRRLDEVAGRIAPDGDW